MNNFKLYNYYRSSASFRVRIALNLKGLKYDYIPVHLLKNGGEQKLPEYLQKNPMGQVPCLEHNGQFISQSMAILLYLEDIAPQPPLFVGSSFEKAKILEVCEVINSGIQPLHNTAVAAELEKRFSASQESRVDWMKFWIEKGLTALEKSLSTTAGTYCFGGTVTAADVCLVPQLFSARRFVGPTDHFQLLTQIENNCMKLEAFRRAEPSIQPDAGT